MQLGTPVETELTERQKQAIRITQHIVYQGAVEGFSSTVLAESLIAQCEKFGLPLSAVKIDLSGCPEEQNLTLIEILKKRKQDFDSVEALELLANFERAQQSAAPVHFHPLSPAASDFVFSIPRPASFSIPNAAIAPGAQADLAAEGKESSASIPVPDAASPSDLLIGQSVAAAHVNFSFEGFLRLNPPTADKVPHEKDNDSESSEKTVVLDLEQLVEGDERDKAEIPPPPPPRPLRKAPGSWGAMAFCQIPPPPTSPPPSRPVPQAPDEDERNSSGNTKSNKKKLSAKAEQKQKGMFPLVKEVSKKKRKQKKQSWFQVIIALENDDYFNLKKLLKEEVKKEKEQKKTTLENQLWSQFQNLDVSPELLAKALICLYLLRERKECEPEILDEFSQIILKVVFGNPLKIEEGKIQIKVNKEKLFFEHNVLREVLKRCVKVTPINENEKNYKNSLKYAVAQCINELDGKDKSDKEQKSDMEKIETEQQEAKAKSAAEKVKEEYDGLINGITKYKFNSSSAEIVEHFKNIESRIREITEVSAQIARFAENDFAKRAKNLLEEAKHHNEKIDAGAKSMSEEQQTLLEKPASIPAKEDIQKLRNFGMRAEKFVARCRERITKIGEISQQLNGLKEEAQKMKEAVEKEVLDEKKRQKKAERRARYFKKHTPAPKGSADSSKSASKWSFSLPPVTSLQKAAPAVVVADQKKPTGLPASVPAPAAKSPSRSSSPVRIPLSQLAQAAAAQASHSVPASAAAASEPSAPSFDRDDSSSPLPALNFGNVFTPRLLKIVGDGSSSLQPIVALNAVSEILDPKEENRLDGIEALLLPSLVAALR